MCPLHVYVLVNGSLCVVQSPDNSRWVNMCIRVFCDFFQEYGGYNYPQNYGAPPPQHQK